MGKAGEKILKALTQLYSHYLLIKIVSWCWVIDKDADATHNQWYPRRSVGQQLPRPINKRCKNQQRAH